MQVDGTRGAHVITETSLLLWEACRRQPDPAAIERSAGVENNSGVRRGEGVDGLIANAEGLVRLGVTLLPVGCTGPDYDLSAAEALCKWRDSR